MMRFVVVFMAFGLLIAGCTAGRLTCRGPSHCLERVVRAAGKNEPQDALRYFSAQTAEVVEEYRELSVELDATNLPADPMAVFLAQMRVEHPKVTGCETDGNRAGAAIEYANGVQARLEFVRENDVWKLDLARELIPTVELLRQARDRLVMYKHGYESGKPVPKPDGDDDD
jgi:hypothetical protein